MRCLFNIISRLPWWFLYGFSDLAFLVVYYIARYRRKVVESNLRNSFPEKSDVELKKIEKEFYRHFCDNIVETVKLMTISSEEISRRIKFKGLETVDTDALNGRHQLLITSHFGNWEMISGMPMWFKNNFICHFYKQLNNPTFDKIMCDLRERFGSHSVETHKALRYLSKTRKEQNAIGIIFLADQSPILPHEAHHWVTFLNQKTPFLFSAEKISKMLNCAWYYCDIKKIKRGYYEVEAIKMCDDITAQPEYAMTDLYVSLLEKTIRRQPAYYLWSHNRWKFSHEYEHEVKEGLAK